MKFAAPLALFALAAGVSAQDPDCEANYIVDQCLATTTELANDCDTQDYECLCAAYQAIRTCYNNCPNDSRISSSDSQVTIYCQNASLFPSTKTSAVSRPVSTSSTPTPTQSDDSPEPTEDTENTDANPNEGGATELARNTGAVLLAVAGVMVAIL